MITVIPHRVPSPREIALHTQSVMQNALIKKKLEEQRENYRKRQDQQQQQQIQQRASSPINSPAKQTMSPTPLAFTPTSVLRKMTADKEPDGANQFHQIETFSISAAISGNNRSRMLQCPNNYQMHAFASSVNLSKISNSVNQVQNETLKMIFLRSAITNHKNNNTILHLEESALKTKYLSSLEEKQEDTDDNANINITKENAFLDVNANANDDNVKATEESIELNAIDNNSDANNDNDNDNNSCTSLDEALIKSSDSEMAIDEDDKITESATTNGIGNIDSQNTTVPVIHDINV